MSTKSSSGRNRFFDFESSSYVRFVIDPILIAELGVATLVVGGTLAYRAYSQDRSFLQTATGLFLIASIACLGVAIYRTTGGMPLQ